MNGIWATAYLGIAGVLGDTFVFSGRGEPPPLPYTAKNATMPGKIPDTAKSLDSGWSHQYKLEDVHLETGHNGTIFFSATYFLHKDGTYQFLYHARWNVKSSLPVGIGMPRLPGLPSIPGVGSSAELDGLNVEEQGTFELSGEILLLQPEQTFRTEIKANKPDKPQKLANENRALLVRVDGRNLYIAGRCAKYQLDPVCDDAKDVRYKLTSQVNSRWAGRKP